MRMLIPVVSKPAASKKITPRPRRNFVRSLMCPSRKEAFQALCCRDSTPVPPLLVRLVKRNDSLCQLLLCVWVWLLLVRGGRETEFLKPQLGRVPCSDLLDVLSVRHQETCSVETIGNQFR